MVALAHAEHLELALVPADHDVHAQAPLTDVIGSHELFGGDERIEQRRVHGAEHGEVCGRCEQAGRPGHAFEARSVKIGVPPVALPARDRQHEVDAGFVRHAGKPQAVRPARRPSFRHGRRGAARGAVRAK
jgi:hypothetical protein